MWQRVVAVVALAAVVSPVVRGVDSFPLSTYPMYAGRGTRVSTLATADGIDAAGERHRLSLAAIAGTDDPLIAESSVGQAIRDGRAGALCEQIARRVAPDLVRIEVVEESHDVVARTRKDESLLARRVHASCEVRR